MNRKLLLYFFIVSSLFPVLTLRGQEFPMLHFTMEDGMPSNNIYTVYRDSRGFLWMATDKGIARFNGVKFESFTTFDGLTDNEVFFFQEDHENRLWCATFNGDICYYKDGAFHNATNTPFLKLKRRSPQIYGIYLNKDSSLNILFFDYNYFLNVYKDTHKEYILKPDLLKDYKLSAIYLKTKIAPDKYKLIGDGYNIVIDTSCRIVEVKKNRLHDPVIGFRSQAEHFFISKEYLFDENLNIIRPFKKHFFEENVIHAYYSDSSNFFYSTSNGLFINDSIRILKKSNVTSVTQDKTGNYWISTLNNGVFCLKKDFLKSRIYKNAYRGAVRYCYQDSSNIFFAVDSNNLFRFERGKATSLFDYRKFKKVPYTIPGNAGFVLDKIANDYDYYNIYDQDRIYIHNILSPKRDITAYTVHEPHVVKDVVVSDKKILVREINMVNVYDKEAFKRRLNDCHVYQPDSSDRSRVFSIAKGEGDAFYYSTINSVYKVRNGMQMRQPRFGYVTFKTFGIFNKYLLGVTPDNILVVCNNFESDIFIDSQVSNQRCVWQKLYQLDSSHVLIATNNLYRIITLYPSNGKPKYELQTVENPFIPLDAEGICSDGKICNFFKNGAVTSVEMKDLLEKPEAPCLFFTFMKTSSRKLYRIESEMQIPYAQGRNLTISFITRSFGGKNVYYQYSVSKNGQDNWRELKSEEINLVNPGFGNYTIKVRASTMSSMPSIPVEFMLHIKRPYWATWWFITLCVCLGALVIGGGIRFRILYLVSKNRKEHEAEIKFIKLEYKALNALMNPHFIFNTLNNVQSLFNGNDKLAANEYLRIFADLIRQNMYNVSKELIPLQKEVALVMNYLILEKMRFEDRLSYDINIDEDIDTSEIMIPPLLLQPLVENSIKHGILQREDKIGEVQIHIFVRKDKLYIEVKDNGAGISHSKEERKVFYESFGMDNIRKRIQQLSIIQDKDITMNFDQIHDENGNHLWTVVTIIMPLSD
jgi:hypothetical protein